MKKIPTFTLRADDPNALSALFTLGSMTEKPSEKRDEILNAALEFSRYQDNPDRYCAGDNSEEETHA